MDWKGVLVVFLFCSSGTLSALNPFLPSRWQPHGSQQVSATGPRPLATGPAPLSLVGSRRPIRSDPSQRAHLHVSTVAAGLEWRKAIASLECDFGRSNHSRAEPCDCRSADGDRERQSARPVDSVSGRHQTAAPVTGRLAVEGTRTILLIADAVALDDISAFPSPPIPPPAAPHHQRTRPPSLIAPSASAPPPAASVGLPQPTAATRSA